MTNGHRPGVSITAEAGLPRTETETILLEIWSTILGSDRLGINDDFLTLGGDSLEAMRCINRIRTIFDVELPVEVFFLEPASVVAVAAELDRLRSETLGSSTSATDDGPVKLTRAGTP